MPDGFFPDDNDDNSPRRPVSVSRGQAKAKPTTNRVLLIGITAFGSLLVLVAAWMIFGAGKRGDDKPHDMPAESGSKTAGKKKRLVASKPTAARAGESKNSRLVVCKFYTPEPGFYVLVDDEPARDETGEQLTTPCEVGIPTGNHTLVVAREKFRDHSEEVLVSQERTFEFALQYEPFAEPAGYCASRLAHAVVGQPVELEIVNAGGPVWDPFLSSDGLNLWIAGQKDEGKGIYLARRTSLFGEFSKPELLVKNTDLAASPSVTADQLVIAYAVRGKAQIRSLVRNESTALFKQGPVLRSTEQDDEKWPVAQISADGKTLYYVRTRKRKSTALMTTRHSLRKMFDDEPKSIALPGGHPQLSEDGRRQYAFDGKSLLRSNRKDVDTPFSAPELMGSLNLENYTMRADFRQYFVSDDEQWLYYSDDPRDSGKLFAVRLTDGPARGFVPRGKSIPQRELAQLADESEMSGDESDTTDPETMQKKGAEPVVVDPRSAPLPYVEFRDRLDALLAERRFADAEAMVNEARNDSAFEKDKTMLEWDLEEVQLVAQFWKRIETAINQLKPGDIVRAGSVQVVFESYEDGAFLGKVRGSDKELSRPLKGLAPADLVALIDQHAARSDEQAQFEIGTFLAISPKVSPQFVTSRLDRAGTRGKYVIERQHLRKLHVIEQEIARGNLGVGLQLIDQLLSAAPKSNAAAQARELRDQMPAKIEWTPVGSQMWDSAIPGDHTAIGAKSPNSYLIAPTEYGNFVVTLEWKTSQQTAQGGVFFHFRKGGDLRRNAFKIHFANDFAIRDNPDRFSTGSLFGIKGPRRNMVKAAGEWNTLVLRVEATRVRATINSVEVLDTPVSDANIGSQGYICLDGEFGGITYRKVVVYELPGSRTVAK